MNQRLLSVFVFALVVAAAASFLVYRLISSHVFTATPTSTATLIVADHDLQTGELIHAADVRKVAWSGPVPAQAVLKVEDAVGRGVVTRIFSNEPLVSGRLAAQGAGAGLAATIPVGMRAAALRVNDVVGLAGFVLPGMRVDVVVAGAPPGGDAIRGGTVSRTVLQNLEVLSANQRIERNAEGKPEDAQVVNLLVTPDQAEVLNLASGEAKVQLVMRNPLDTKEQVTHGTTSYALFGINPPSSAATALRTMMRIPAAAPSPAPRLIAKSAKPDGVSVEVFSGTKRTEQRFGANAEEQ